MDFVNEDSNVQVVTAPLGCGKSTMVDMLKRFFEVQVDRLGRPVFLKNNTNYKLFCEKPLVICQNNTEFIGKYFGQHPVMHMNFSPLKNVTNFALFSRAMDKVLRNTYAQHAYFLNDLVVPHLYSMTKQAFRKMLKNSSSPTEVKYFPRLAEILQEYFGRKVIILFDDYDALRRILSEESRIAECLKSLGAGLFKDNEHVWKTMVTGVVDVREAGMSTLFDRFEQYRFVGDTLENYNLICT